MRAIAQKRGIQVLDGVAEEVPFDDLQFDFVLMVTTVCFVDDLRKAFLEAHRVLSYDGCLIIGFIDRNSRVGQVYLKRKEKNVFYKDATFFSTDELVEILTQVGFTDLTFKQTIFGNLAETTSDEPVTSGYGKGSFVVIRGKKQKEKMA
jgi:ubiquinone/menaquinone biosynthesis C-methylase UbiE